MTLFDFITIIRTEWQRIFIVNGRGETLYCGILKDFFNHPTYNRLIKRNVLETATDGEYTITITVGSSETVLTMEELITTIDKDTDVLIRYDGQFMYRGKASELPQALHKGTSFSDIKVEDVRAEGDVLAINIKLIR